MSRKWNSEIITAVQEGQKLIIILINNHGFGSINGLSLSLGSKGFGNQYRKREKETDGYTGGKLPVDYAAHAKAIGIDSTKVQTKKEWEDAISAARDSSASTTYNLIYQKDISAKDYTIIEPNLILESGDYIQVTAETADKITVTLTAQEYMDEN